MSDYDSPAAKSSTGRNLVIAVLTIPLLCGSCGLLGFLYARGEMGYEEAVERASNDPKVKALLGAPVTTDFFFSGQGKGHNDVGRAVLSITLHGSLQGGTLVSSGVKTGGAWGFSKLLITADNGKTVSLVKD